MLLRIHLLQVHVIVFATQPTCTYQPNYSDPTLRLNNLLSALESLPHRKWEELGGCLQVPCSIRDKIRGDRHNNSQRMEALLNYYVHNHPVPSWKLLAEGLYAIRHFTALEVVQRTYSKGMCSSLLSEY